MMSGLEPVMVCEGSVRLVFQATPFLVMLQVFTSVAFQETVVLPSESVRVGLAVIETVGERTVTVACAGAEVLEALEQVTE